MRMVPAICASEAVQGCGKAPWRQGCQACPVRMRVGSQHSLFNVCSSSEVLPGYNLLSYYS